MPSSQQQRNPSHKDVVVSTFPVGLQKPQQHTIITSGPQLLRKLGDLLINNLDVQRQQARLLLLLLHLITHPTKCYTNLKVHALSEKKTLNKCIFKCFAKVAGLTVRSLNSTGNSFQQLGPATAKALKPQSVLWLGTTRSPQTADLKADRPETAKPLVQKATR